MTLTGGVAGVPFTVASSVTGGDATIGAATEATAAESKHHFMLAANYEGGVAPVNDDIVSTHRDAPNVCWGLDTSLTGLTLRIPDGVAKVGLRADAFATSADGESVDESVPEYRQTYLKGSFDLTVIGQQAGPSLVATPSSRIKVENSNTGAGDVFVYHVRGTSSEVGLPTCRLLFVEDSEIVVNAFSCIGGIGIAIEDDGELSDMYRLNFLVSDGASSLRCGVGASAEYVTQTGGNVLLRSQGTVTLATLNGGILTTQDGLEFQITTLTVNGGTANIGNSDSSDIAVATLNGNAGAVNMLQSKPGSIISATNPTKGFAFTGLRSDVVLTAINESTDGVYAMGWS